MQCLLVFEGHGLVLQKQLNTTADLILALSCCRSYLAPNGTVMTGPHVHSHTQARKQGEEILEHSLTQALHALTGKR